MPDSYSSYFGCVCCITHVQRAESPIQECISRLGFGQLLSWSIEVGSEEVERAIGRRVVRKAYLIWLSMFVSLGPETRLQT